MEKYIRFSEDLYVLFMRIIGVIIFVVIVYLAIKDIAEYANVLILLSFVLFGWIVIGKLFSVKKVAFNEKYIRINNKVYGLNEVQQLRTSSYILSSVTIDNKKYYFIRSMVEFFSQKKTQQLRRLIDLAKSNYLQQRV